MDIPSNFCKIVEIIFITPRLDKAEIYKLLIYLFAIYLEFKIDFQTILAALNTKIILK